MNITFLIGNGFDLNLGLKTDYRSFIKEYTKDLNEPVIMANDTYYLKKEISKDEDTWANAEIAFGKITQQFVKDGKNADLFSDCHEDFCLSLAEYLKQQQGRIDWNQNSQSIGEAFVNSINSFKSYFPPVETQNINNHESKFAGSYVFNFVNFNYTDTLYQCINAVKTNKIDIGSRVFANTKQNSRIGKIYNVNGTVDNYMVFGVNDETQVGDKKLFEGYSAEYMGQLIKADTDRLNGQNTYNNVSSLISQSDFIYIYGMSTGITDSRWWEMICEWLVGDNNHQLFIHKHAAPERGLIPRKYATYEKNVRKDFLSFSMLKGDEMDKYYDSIHIHRENIFEGLYDLSCRKPVKLSDYLLGAESETRDDDEIIKIVDKAYNATLHEDDDRILAIK